MYICTQKYFEAMAEKELNQIKLVLIEHKRTNKRLAGQLGRDQAIISKWCSNSTQPSLKALMQIAQHLNSRYKKLICFPEM